VALQQKLAHLGLTLSAYSGSDHDTSFYDSPFMLELDEELIALNIQVERMIRRLDPFYEGTYLRDEQ
jgi:hypothetical protein